jgi:vancomycin resistance protein YoaR
MLQAYMHGVQLPASYGYDKAELKNLLKPIKDSIFIEPVDAKFTFQNGRVEEFRQSSDGRDIDFEELQSRVSAKTLSIIAAEHPQRVTIPIPLAIIKPKITTEQVNNLGVKELVGSGTSLFVGSIPNRMYNIALAATRLDGILIKPGEIFSFNKAVGDISTFTGYKQAYIIQNGRTVLGDGGGVCQVSTTLFRAVLSAGLSVVERNPHAYRVGYYEQDSGPGIDAAIYVPTVDLKFKNDTDHYLLIQTIVDPESGRLSFNLYGTKDNRQVEISKPVITSVSSSPEPLYIDDPTLPKGETKQVDFAVPGANVYFTRVVKKDGKVIISDKFTSAYRAWQAVYMRGTKES